MQGLKWEKEPRKLQSENDFLLCFEAKSWYLQLVFFKQNLNSYNLFEISVLLLSDISNNQMYFWYVFCYNSDVFWYSYITGLQKSR